MNKDMVDYVAMLKLVRSVCHKASLRVEYIDADAVPYTDGDSLYVSKPDPSWDKATWMTWVDGVYHEAGHNMPANRDAFDLVKRERIDIRSLFGNAFNIVDDFRVDRNRCDAYYGMQEAIDVAMPILVKQQADKPYPFDELSGNNLKGAEIIWTLKAFDVHCRGVDSLAMRSLASLFEPAFTPNCERWFEKLVSEYTEKYISNETAQDELDMLRDIFANVFEVDSESVGDKQAPQPQPGKGSGEGESKDGGKGASGKGEPKYENNEEGNSKGSGESASDEEGDGDGDPQSGTVNYEDLLRHPVGKDGIKGDRDAEMRIVYGETGRYRPYDPHTDASTKTINYWKGEEGPSAKTGYQATYPKSVNEMLDQLNVASITAQARRLLLAETRKRPHFNQKKGRLDTSKIFRVTMPENSSSERIFKTKEVSKALDTSVTLLVDYSGSMVSRDKISVAISGAVAFSNLLNTLRVNTEILGFTETYRGNEDNLNLVFKPFGVNVPQEKLVDIMCKGTAELCNNADGDSILVAYNRIMEQKTPRKIIIVLSDGSPAATRGDVDGFTQKVIKNIEAGSRVDILGIGILDDNVERLYKHNKVARKLGKLPEVLIQTLESVILEK